MVAQRSPKPFVRVQVLVGLPPKSELLLVNHPSLRKLLQHTFAFGSRFKKYPPPVSLLRIF